MRALRLGLILLGLMAVGLKLFTYECFYADGPTSGAVAVLVATRRRSGR